MAVLVNNATLRAIILFRTCRYTARDEAAKTLLDYAHRGGDSLG